MQLGCAVPVSGSWASAAGIDEVATLAEALGYRSLWVFQRLLCPVDDAGLPQLEPQYRSVDDPLAVLAYLAARTSAPRLGVAVVNAPYYSPILLAKAMTTVDRLSGGRLDAGVGLGWLRQEFDAVGVPIGHRGARTEDFVHCLRAIWTDDVVDYHGPYFDVPRSRIDPKPVQRPHPPILFGGSAEAALRRAGRVATGWVSSSRADITSIAESIAVVRSAAASSGRDPDALRFVCRAVVKLRDGSRGPLTGSIQDVRADLASLSASGVTEAFVDLNFDPTVASPDADPDAALRHARGVLEALAPAGS